MMPPPRVRDSIVSPPIDNIKRAWNSRVGYFVTLSDIKVHGDDIQVYASPEVDFYFQSQPNEYLKLGAGESWQSDWIDSGVIRGIDINVIGRHKLSHIKNGDFET